MAGGIQQLIGKRALVTGASKGIGRAIATRFAMDGARVMIHGHSASDAYAAAASLRESGFPAEATSGDLSDPAVCEAVIADTVKAFDGIDILVNNAALIVRGNIENTDAGLFDQVMAVNVRAPMLLFRAALPHFRRQGGGRVLNIGSINAYCGESNLLAYSISKGALMTLTRNLSDVHGIEGVRVNQFNVGWVLTETEHAIKVGEGLPANWHETLPPSIVPSGRLFSPEEIAHFAVCFVSDSAQLLSGTVVDLEQHTMIGRNAAKA